MRNYIHILWSASLFALLCAGCPQSATSAPTLTARITISSTTGGAPHTVSVSAAGSTSPSGIESVEWDFAGQRTVSTTTATHTFFEAGRHRVTLIVRDADGNTDKTFMDVRVAGGIATARIAASVIEGVGPLRVDFDASASGASPDVVRDFIWDFGDGQRGFNEFVSHTFTRVGTFTVRLTIVTEGGTTDQAAVAIFVRAPDAPAPDPANEPNAPSDPNAPADPNTPIDPNAP